MIKILFKSLALILLTIGLIWTLNLCMTLVTKGTKGDWVLAISIIVMAIWIFIIVVNWLFKRKKFIDKDVSNSMNID